MKRTFLAAIFLAALCVFTLYANAADEKWPGVDDTVVGRYAEEHGRAARPNLIELDGDALLFAFLLAGVAGGFTMGYYYRDLTAKKDRDGETDAR